MTDDELAAVITALGALLQTEEPQAAPAGRPRWRIAMRNESCGYE